VLFSNVGVGEFILSDKNTLYLCKHTTRSSNLLG
jgi:hypothetical protein